MNQQLGTGLQREKALADSEQATAKDVTRLRRMFVAAARDLQGVEAKLTALEAELAALDDEQARENAALETRREQTSEVVNALVRITRRPPEAMVALPRPPIDTVRGFILFRDSEPALRAEAVRIKDHLARLAALRDEKVRIRAQLGKAQAALEVKADELKRLQQEKEAILDRTSRDRQALAKRNQRIASERTEQAKDIHGLIRLIEKLKRQREEEARRAAQTSKPEARQAKAVASAVPKPLDIHDFTGEKGSLLRAVQGPIVRLYGAKDEFGATSKGIVIESRAAAQVVAPFDGVVVFAGPFRGYGRILLIEHGGGYHTLLAGLGRILSVPGQWVLAGEPVAVMDDTGSGRSRLYVEFRRNGQPINPLPWLAAAQSRVSG
ncbi:MAG: murein hydrolase activator EnvC family protein [Kiloniellales bacterium]